MSNSHIDFIISIKANIYANRKGSTIMMASYTKFEHLETSLVIKSLDLCVCMERDDAKFFFLGLEHHLLFNSLMLSSSIS